MLSLRNCNYVVLPATIRSLAEFVGIRGIISVRDLMHLLGSKDFGAVPVYFLGHNTNSIGAVVAALGQGANAIEVDVTAYESDLNRLCIDHAGLTGNAPGGSSAPRFEDFLKDLRGVADSEAGRALALVVFDCKPPAATPRHGRTILETVRRVLSDDTRVNVIISVGDVTSSNPYRLDGTSVFDDIALDIHAREGLMIDEEGSPDRVATFFSALGVTRFCYGNGTSDPFSDEGAMVYRIPIERACWLTVTHNEPRFVYAWTVSDTGDQELYLRVGVNGVIADPNGLSHISGILKQPEYSARFRLALRTDNPFLPPNSAYGLTVRTSDIDKAGTDANVQFTLTGENGSSSISVDTKYNGRMEAGGVNFVVLPSPDLGALRVITVQRDDSGNAPDWHLDSIEIQSYRFRVNHTALFNCWVGTDKLTRPVS